MSHSPTTQTLMSYYLQSASSLPNSTSSSTSEKSTNGLKMDSINGTECNSAKISTQLSKTLSSALENFTFKHFISPYGSKMPGNDAAMQIQNHEVPLPIDTCIELKIMNRVEWEEVKQHQGQNSANARRDSSSTQHSTLHLVTNSDLLKYRIGRSLAEVGNLFQELVVIYVDRHECAQRNETPPSSRVTFGRQQVRATQTPAGCGLRDRGSELCPMCKLSLHNLLSMLLSYVHSNNTALTKEALPVKECLIILEWLLLEENRSNDKWHHMRALLLNEALDVNWRIDLERVAESIGIILGAYYKDDHCGSPSGSPSSPNNLQRRHFPDNSNTSPNSSPSSPSQRSTDSNPAHDRLSENQMQSHADRGCYWFLERLLRKIWANRTSSSLLTHLHTHLSEPHWRYIKKRIQQRDQWHHYDVIMRFDSTYTDDMKKVLYHGESRDLRLVLARADDVDGEIGEGFLVELVQDSNAGNHYGSTLSDFNTLYIILPVHKQLLMAKCPYFTSLFKSTFREATSNEISMLTFLAPPRAEHYEDQAIVSRKHNTLRLQVMKKYIEYLYTDHITFTNLDLILSILFADQMTQGAPLQPRLHKQAISALGMSLNAKNVCPLIELFHSQGLQPFQAVCIKYGLDKWDQVCDFNGVEALPEVLLRAKQAAEEMDESERHVVRMDPRSVLDM